MFKYILLLFLCSCSFLYAQKYDSLIRSHLNQFPEQCEIAIGIIEGDKEYTFGYRKSTDSIRAIKNNNTLFEIGSLTKVFTASMLMQEVSEGTVSLEDRVQDHLPEVRIKQDSFGGEFLQIKHLTTHTSGLKHRPFMSFEKYSKYLRGLKINYKPGSNWQYNNMAVALLGHIILEKKQQSWEEALQSSLLNPLQMKNTYSNSSQAPLKGRMQCVDKKRNSGDCRFETQDPFIWPSGSMVSNMNDLMVWLRANIETPTIVSYIKSTHQIPADNIPNPYFKNGRQGYIWWHIDPATNDYIAHGGTTPDHTIMFFFSKQNRKGVIVYANANWPELQDESGSLLTNNLAMEILNIGY